MADDVNVTPAQTMRLAGQRASATTENLRELSVTLIGLAQANIQTAFDFARQATAVTTPADMVKLWAEHVPKQLELLSAQTKQLTELGQRMATRAASSVAHQK